MHRTSIKVLLIVAAFALFLVPVAAIAAAGFGDVADDNVFKADIQWLADAGVTKGCNPPANTEFCPGANVTREQMSAFMHRLAVNKVVDAATAVEADSADTLDGRDSTALLAAKGKAADSDLLDGKDSTAFLGTTEKAADSDRLDGFDSDDLVSVYGATGGMIDDFLAADPVSLLTHTIDTGVGYLHITTVTSLADDSTLAGLGGVSSQVFVDGAGLEPAELWWSPVECVAILCDLGTVTTTAVAPVDAGSHTIEIRAEETRSGTFIYSTSMSILFTPFGEASVPLGSPRSSARQPQN